MTEKKKMGRKLKVIDAVMVEKLASIFCTMEQIASFCSCSVDTLENRFSDVIEKGRNNGRSSLLKKQFEVAMKGNVVMLIWMGKQHLGQSDKNEIRSTDEPFALAYSPVELEKTINKSTET